MNRVLKFGGSRQSRREKAAQEALREAAMTCPGPLEFTMSPKQYEFHAHCGEYRDDGVLPPGYELSHDLFGGAAGGGKSRAICDSALLTAYEEPGSRIAILRKTKKSLDASTKQVFLDFACPEGGTKWTRLGISWNKQDDIMTLLATAAPDRDLPPSEIWWLGIQTSEGQRNEAWERFLSTQFSRIYIDEAAEAEEEIVAMFPTRCRLYRPGKIIRLEQIYRRDGAGNIETGPDGNPVVERVEPRYGYRLGMKYASNPAPNWLKRWFVDPKPLREPYKFIQSKISDNRKNLPPGYEKTFERLPDYLRKRFLDGDWTAFEGQVFPGGVTELHVLRDIDPFSLSPKWWQIIQAVDPGLNDPTAAVWAAFRFDEHYRAIVFLEDYLERESTIEAHAMRFKAIEERLGLSRWRNIERIIDPEANKRSLTNVEQTVRSMFADCGLFYENAPNGTDAKTFSMAKALEIDTERRNPMTGETGAPLVYFTMPGCRRTASALTDLQWSSVCGGDGGQEWVNRNKHLPDVATYITALLRTRERKTERGTAFRSRYSMRYEEYA